MPRISVPSPSTYDSDLFIRVIIACPKMVTLKVKRIMIARQSASSPLLPWTPQSSTSSTNDNVPMTMLTASQPTAVSQLKKDGDALPRMPKGAREMVSIAVPARGPAMELIPSST